MKKILILLLSIMICGAYCHSLQALDEEQASNEVTPADVISYPLKLGKEVAEVGVNAGKKVIETTADTGQATAEVLTGDVKQAPAIVTTPVKGVAEGVGETAEDIVNAPANAAKQ
ncbi:MAG: hypothetical protein Q8Q33_07180 [Chlamydiota bacterium]|nr:hypothetical protein [Chlamydiota bacterium]